MKNYKITREEYKTSKWSGGETRELFIYPPESSLEERNFQVRISSATVELEESGFSPFIGYDRIIMVLKGKVRLEHKSNNGDRTAELQPFMQDSFSGGEKTKSFGSCIDFNVISREGIISELRTVINGNIHIEDGAIYHFFAIKPIELELEIKGKVLEVELKEDESYVIKESIGRVFIKSKDNEISCLMSSIKFHL